MTYPLRILMISQYGAGLSNPDVQLSGALGRQRDYANSVELYHTIVPAQAGEERIQVQENLIVHPVKSSGTIDFLRKARELAKQLHKEFNYTHFMVDNPHTAGLYGVFIKKDLGIPFVLHTMSDMIRNPWYKKERFSNHAKSWLMEIAAQHADLIRVSTQAEVDKFANTALGSKVQRVSFYVDQEQIETKLATITAEKQPKSLLYVGRLGPQKDLPVLLKAMAKVKLKHADAQLTIVGGGPDEVKLKQLANALKLNDVVTFTGPVPYDQVMTYFAEAQCFVISSLHEGTCMVLHEAGLANVPIVATAFAGAVDLVENGTNGYVVEPRDVAGFASHIIKLLDDPKAAKRMGEENYRRVKQVDRAYALQEWQQLCERMVALGGTSST